jgi:DinB family protein
MSLDASLFTALGTMPGFLHAAAQGLSPDDLATAPRGGGFSLVEHACHLRDFEAEACLVRIARILAEDEPALADFDGDRLALERSYKTQDFTAALRDYERHRAQCLAALAGLTAAQLDRTTRFGAIGRITLRRLVEMIAEHDATHREEIDHLLAELRAACPA